MKPAFPIFKIMNDIKRLRSKLADFRGIFQKNGLTLPKYYLFKYTLIIP
jgi:hypothetical protein